MPDEVGRLFPKHFVSRASREKPTRARKLANTAYSTSAYFFSSHFALVTRFSSASESTGIDMAELAGGIRTVGVSGERPPVDVSESSAFGRARWGVTRDGGGERTWFIDDLSYF